MNIRCRLFSSGEPCGLKEGRGWAWANFSDGCAYKTSCWEITFRSGGDLVCKVSLMTICVRLNGLQEL